MAYRIIAELTYAHVKFINSRQIYTRTIIFIKSDWYTHHHIDSFTQANSRTWDGRLTIKCLNRDLLQPIARLVYCKLYTTTCSKQDVRLAEADHVVCFSQSCGYYTLLLLCLLLCTDYFLLCRGTLWAFFHETICMNNRGVLPGQLNSSPYRIQLRETHQKTSAGCIIGYP